MQVNHRLSQAVKLWWNRSNGPWLRRQWNRIFLPIREPAKFLDIERTKQELTTSSEALSTQILDEARGIFADPLARADGVERRATTLLGTVAIATSLSVAGAGIILDSQGIDSRAWRSIIAVGFLATTCCFVMCGWRALLALSRVHTWMMPADSEIFGWSKMRPAEARIHLAASLLKSAGANEPILEWKVAHLGAATWWFLRALVLLVVTALTLSLYGILSSNAQPSEGEQSDTCRPDNRPDLTLAQSS